MISGVSYGVAGFIAFIAAVTFHIHLVRKRFAPVPHILALWFTLAVVVVVAVLSLERRDALVLATTNLCVYLFAGEMLLFVYAASIGSISIRLLVTMRGLESSPESFESTLEQYSAGNFLDIRLGTLLAKGLFIECHGRYEITRRGRQWAHTVGRLKRIFAVGAGG
jgi:hypothetical protein